VSVNALVLAALSLAGLLSAELLLALTFVNGVGLAMRWPVFAAIVPQVVSRDQLPAALALNGIAMNLARIIGPVAAGALIAAVSPAAVFVVNVLLAGIAFTLILRWRSERRPASPLPGERFVGAMRVGLNYAMRAPRLRVVLLRIFLFFLQSTALVALLPLSRAARTAAGPALFTVMLSCLGVGAIVAALYFPRWRARQAATRSCASARSPRGAVVADRAAAGDLDRASRDGRDGHGVDLGRQLADRHGASRCCRLGACARHVDLPDGADGRGRGGLVRLGQVATFTSVRSSVLAAAAFACSCWRRLAGCRSRAWTASTSRRSRARAARRSPATSRRSRAR